MLINVILLSTFNLYLLGSACFKYCINSCGQI